MIRAFFEDRNYECDIIVEWQDDRFTHNMYKSILATLYDMTTETRDIICNVEINGVPSMCFNSVYYEGIKRCGHTDFSISCVRVYGKNANGMYKHIRSFHWLYV